MELLARSRSKPSLVFPEHWLKVMKLSTGQKLCGLFPLWNSLHLSVASVTAEISLNEAFRDVLQVFSTSSSYMHTYVSEAS